VVAAEQMVDEAFLATPAPYDGAVEVLSEVDQFVPDPATVGLLALGGSQVLKVP